MGLGTASSFVFYFLYDIICGSGVLDGWLVEQDRGTGWALENGGVIDATGSCLTLMTANETVLKA